jgi:hypothetical protein
MKLTFEKDKMPALAALTQKMETLRADDRVWQSFGRRLCCLIFCGWCGQVRKLVDLQLFALLHGLGRLSNLKLCGSLASTLFLAQSK